MVAPAGDSLAGRSVAPAGDSLAGRSVAFVALGVIWGLPYAFGLREPLGTRRLAGLATGFFGVVVLLGIGSVHGFRAWAGVGCLLLATVGYAFGSIIVQKHLADTDELGTVAVSLGIASVVLLPVALWTAPTHLPAPLSLLSVGVLGIVCTALALQLYFYRARRRDEDWQSSSW